MSPTSPSIYVDARCLQDPQYQFRGVGHHVSSLLRNRVQTAAKSFRFVALADPDLPPMPDEYAQLFDEVGFCLNPSLPSRGSIFINPSPMTHDPRFGLRFIHHRNLLSAAIVHDFIPFDWPGYLPEVSNRIDYLSKLANLKSLTIFLPNSKYTARRLIEMLGVNPEDVRVTGCSIRSAFFEYARASNIATPSEISSPYFLTVGGGDRRKNTETAVRAVRNLNLLGEHQARLRVVGHYGLDYKADLERAAGGGNGNGFLEFWPGVDDRTLVDLYSGAIASIAPSYIEGFSLPIVEAAVCRSPVIASSCAAHMELIDRPEALFTPDNADELVQRLTRVLTDHSFRESLVHSQAPLAEKYHENAVGSRFWDFIMERFERRFPAETPALRRRAKPKIAFLSPFPPDQSGVARFTELTLDAARKHFDIDLFTNAPRPLNINHGVSDAGNISIHALLKGKYDSILSVMGNSQFHTPIFELFERYGGPCIMHDSRLTHTYFVRLGEERFLQFAGKILGRSVGIDEVRVWLQDKQLPSLFIEPVIERASPLIVHTRPYQELLHQRYGVHAEVASFPPNLHFEEAELAEPHRAVIRDSLGIQPGSFAVSSFGFLTQSKGIFACIVALDLLRSWNIPAELFLVGDPLGLDAAVEHVASNFGVSSHVHLTKEFVPPERYREFMIASDAAIQLRTYGFGQPSAGLVDCISAGLPAVAGCSLADACDAPSYVGRIPDHISALLLAERLAEIWEKRQTRVETAEERALYCQQHSFEQYAERLVEILNL